MASIELSELKILLEKVFQKISFYAGKNSRIDVGSEDYYWITSAPESYDMKTEPKLVVGSFVDDLSELKKLLADPERETTAVDLDRLAALLNAISFHHNPPLEK